MLNYIDYNYYKNKKCSTRRKNFRNKQCRKAWNIPYAGVFWAWGVFSYICRSRLTGFVQLKLELESFNPREKKTNKPAAETIKITCKLYCDMSIDQMKWHQGTLTRIKYKSVLSMVWTNLISQLVSLRTR